MKEFDWSRLVKNDVKYKELVDDVSELYRCAWDDSIHDSFFAYVRQVQEQSDQIHRIRLTAEKLEEEIRDLNLDALEKHVDNLCMEVDSI